MPLVWHAPLVLVASMALCSCIHRDPCTREVPVTDEFCMRLLTAIDADGAVVIGRLASTLDVPCYRCGEDPTPTAEDPSPYEPAVWILRLKVEIEEALIAPAPGAGDSLVVYDGAECLREPPEERSESSFHAKCLATLDAVAENRSGLWVLVPALPGDTYYLADRCRDRHDAATPVIWQQVFACSAPYVREQSQDQWPLGEGFAVTSEELRTVVAAAVANAASSAPSYGPDACRSWIEQVTGRVVPTVVGGCD